MKNLKKAAKIVVASAAFRKIAVAAIIAAATAAGLSLDPQLADALGQAVIIAAGAL